MYLACPCPFLQLPCFTPIPLWVEVAPPARTVHQPSLIKTPLMRWTEYLTSSQPARATSTNCPTLHARPPLIPHLLPTAACLPVSDWCCHGNGKVEVSILLLPAWLILFPAVCVCAPWPCSLWAEYLLSPSTVLLHAQSCASRSGPANGATA